MYVVAHVTCSAVVAHGVVHGGCGRSSCRSGSFFCLFVLPNEELVTAPQSGADHEDDTLVSAVSCGCASCLCFRASAAKPAGAPAACASASAAKPAGSSPETFARQWIPPCGSHLLQPCVCDFWAHHEFVRRGQCRFECLPTVARLDSRCTGGCLLP